MQVYTGCMIEEWKLEVGVCQLEACDTKTEMQRRRGSNTLVVVTGGSGGNNDDRELRMVTIVDGITVMVMAFGDDTIQRIQLQEVHQSKYTIFSST